MRLFYFLTVIVKIIYYLCSAIKIYKNMKVYVLTMTSQLGQGDQPSSSVLGVYESQERAEQAHHEAVVAEVAEYVNLYGE